MPEARTTCAAVHLNGALDCGEELFDEASAYTYCEGDEDCTAACCIAKIEVPSLTYTHRETVSTHTATIASEDHTHVVTSSAIVNPATETTHGHTTTYLIPEPHPTEIASLGTTVTIEYTHTPVVTETVATVSTTEYYSHVETGHIPHPDGNIVLHTTRTESSHPTQSETDEPTTTTRASERTTERTTESTTERTTTTREPEPTTERTTTRAPEPTTETIQKPEPTPEEKYYCGDISYYKCSTYRTSLKCCKNSDKCTGWGNCKCTSTTCCDKTVSGAKDPDREITDGSDENNAYCGSVSNNKCEGYKTSRKCCKSGTGKCGGWAVEKCSSSYCCDGTVKATNSNCRRGSRRRECNGRR
ncbi:hypothetical protein SARC_00457 [Sphaeroforma arctica JP610]|uniref:Uncharacterized protein n=1 Tax=Sphaeroforma arctica JP610 TaxID=667725 RepID=A0A0L0GEH9_9EUKA|nr:hypothetical protein SARC_00457 [Sphaeroforma arctica JP610]KNC87420.1 hypothetical protein SARC_00457 [Sphaeroforma arctica JP610]|eukprot:XP_014161322.1 hypothetical protein SARC_00457 [Sphaeroforma arctica JP610]